MEILNQSFLNETGYKAYLSFLAIKRHFTSSYDYHKYNGKVNASYDSFVTRKDAYSFQKIGKKRDYENLILANILVNNKVWAGNLCEDEARDIYLDWKRRQDSISEHFRESLSLLKEDFKSNFEVKNGEYPHIVNLYLQKKISPEVFVILSTLTNSKKYWEDNVIDTVIFPDIIRVVEKYHPFLNYSREKFTKMIKDRFF